MEANKNYNHLPTVKLYKTACVEVKKREKKPDCQISVVIRVRAELRFLWAQEYQQHSFFFLFCGCMRTGKKIYTSTTLSVPDYVAVYFQEQRMHFISSLQMDVE